MAVNKSFDVTMLMAVFSIYVLSSCSSYSKKEETNSEEHASVHVEATEKPRLLILTDIGGDPDDQQSLIRLLVYAHEFDIEGIITERWKKYSGNDQIALVRSILDAYGKVRDNLLKHASGYPTEEYLKSILKQGAVDVVGSARSTGEAWDDYVGEGKDTEGSRFIVSVLEKRDSRPVNIAVWGGTADLAQALFWLRKHRSATELASIISNIRLHAIAHQDITGPWILENFPDLFYILDLSPSGDKLKSVFRGMYMGGDEQLTSLNWINTHIRNGHGPLGALYPSKTHTQHNPHGALKEGDTPSWFYFLSNGLSDPAKPEYGGWGGRFTSGSTYFNDAEDQVGDTTSARATVWRWRPHFQNDFQARMDWCVKSYEEANHNPVAAFNGTSGRDIVHLTVSSGDEVPLSARGSSDPDGDQLSYHWSYYPEPGTYKKEIAIKNNTSVDANFTVPAVDGPETIHIILTVKDNGEPNLYSYRRIVITVNNDE